MFLYNCTCFRVWFLGYCTNYWFALASELISRVFKHPGKLFQKPYFKTEMQTYLDTSDM